jgi:hypothetical protein
MKITPHIADYLLEQHGETCEEFLSAKAQLPSLTYSYWSTMGYGDEWAQRFFDSQEKDEQIRILVRARIHITQIIVALEKTLKEISSELTDLQTTLEG